MGIGSSFFGAWMGAIARGAGVYDWGALDATVDAAIVCGVEPVLKVSAGADSSFSGPAPADLSEWEGFCLALAEHFKGRVRAYAIENEIDKPRMAWTGENYGQLRSAAYAAIKQADPDAYVLDGGMTQSAYLVARAHELNETGKAQEALDVLARFSAGMRLHGADQAPSMPNSVGTLTTWLNQPNAVRQLSLLDELRQHPETVDAIQIHYLTSAWELIPEYLSWIRAWFPGKPIEVWETDYSYDGPDFSEEDHANGVVKTMVSILGESAVRALYEPYWEDVRPTDTDQKQVRKFGKGLVTSGGPRLAAMAYQTMTSQLAGYQEAEPLDLGTGVWAYRFSTPRGEVYVVWGDEDRSIHLPVSAAAVTVTNIKGDTGSADPAALHVGASPVFVIAHW